jgi:two-component sensor histidine kinase
VRYLTSLADIEPKLCICLICEWTSRTRLSCCIIFRAGWAAAENFELLREINRRLGDQLQTMGSMLRL